MIKKFYFDNFKSLVDFRLVCHPLTCLIGLNNSGKSTVLRAIDFLSSVARGGISQWLKGTDWRSRDLKPRFVDNGRSVSLTEERHASNGFLRVLALVSTSN